MKYFNDREGKKQFIEEVISPFVENEQTFAKASYYYDPATHREYIELYSHYGEVEKRINITCDSVEAVARDFCRNFLTFVEDY